MTNKYLTADYATTEISFGYVQALRGEADPTQCGYFVPLSQMEKSGWRNIDPSLLVEYTYNSGTSEVGILLKQPRMVLSAISQLGMFDRTASAKTESFVVVGNWNRDFKGNPDISNFQVYLVMFFDKQNQRLHDIPLKLTAKGAHQASLAEQWQKCCTTIAVAHSKAMGVMFQPRNATYNTLCVFAPTIVRKMVGDSKKSAACYIDGFVAPTAENWQDFFLGTQEDLADAVVGLMKPQPRGKLLNAQSFARGNDSEPAAIAPTYQLQGLVPASYSNADVALVVNGAIDVKGAAIDADSIPY